MTLSIRAVLIAVMFLGNVSFAQVFRYRGPFPDVVPQSSSFFNPESWQVDDVPDIGQIAIFGPEATAGPDGQVIVHFGDFEYQSVPAPGVPMTIPGDTAKTLAAIVEAGSYRFDFDSINVPGGQSGNYFLANGSPRLPGSLWDRTSLRVGAETGGVAGVASLEVTGDGTLTTQFAQIGGVNENAGTPDGDSSGQVLVTGSQTTWQDSGILSVEKNGSIEVDLGATFQVFILEIDGGSVIIRDASTFGDIRDRMVDSGELSVAVGGSLTISNGAQVDVSGRALIGGISGTSSIVVTGVGSRINSVQQMSLGNHFNDNFPRPGDGTLEITDGATVDSKKGDSPTGSSGIVGFVVGATGRATVSGENSRWTHDGALSVGFHGHGEMDVLSQGEVQSVDGFVGRIPGSSGRASVSRGSLWQIENSLFMGGTDTEVGGTASLNVGGAITVANLLQIYSAGQLTLEGTGTVTVGQPPSSTPGGNVHIGTGGTVAGTGSVNGDVWNEAGLVSPGLATGNFQVLGEFRQGPLGILEIEADGLLSHDTLTATENAILDGILSMSFADTFSPDAGDSFDLISVGGSILGDFDEVILSGMAQELQFTTEIDNGVFRLIFETGLAGDFNHDGLLDVRDIDLLSSAVGGNDLLFDLNADRQIDESDRMIWVEDLKNTYYGDADLDGDVDVSDLNQIGLLWQASGDFSWADGDFDSSGMIDSRDLNVIGVNWLKGEPNLIAAVPEPTLSLVMLIIFIGLLRREGHEGNNRAARHV